MHVLFVTPYVPSLIRGRSLNLIRGLAELGHSVSLLSFAQGDDANHLPLVRPYCRHCEIVPLTPRQVAGNLMTAVSPHVPLQAAYGHSREMMARLRAALGGGHIDVVHVEHLRASLLGPAAAGLPRVYDAVDCISLLLERTARSNPQLGYRLMARLELGRTRAFESRLLEHYHRITVTSVEDQQALALLIARRNGHPAEEKLTVLPQGVDLHYYAPRGVAREPDTLVFTGKMSYHANAASALYLGREVMPRVWWHRPQTALWIVGKDPPPAVRALAADRRITVTGFVPDMRPYLARATVAVCPIAYGVGIQNKVLEAMAMGTPVVTSPRARVALQVEAGIHLIIADSPSAFADRIVQLLADDALRGRLGEEARHYVEAHHHWIMIASRLAGVYAEAAGAFGR